MTYHYLDGVWRKDEPVVETSPPIPGDQTYPVAMPAFPLYGWLCPRCGCGNAPGASVCGHCTPPQPLQVWC